MTILPMEHRPGSPAAARRYAAEGHGVVPRGFAGATIFDSDDAVEVVVALNLPIDGEVRDRGIRSSDFTGDGGVLRQRGGGGENCRQPQECFSHQPNYG